MTNRNTETSEAGRSGGVVPLRERARAQLAEGRTPTEVAEALGVERSTVWRWLQRPDFAALASQFNGTSVEGARARIGALVSDALEVLEAVLRDPGAPVQARIQAAREILDRAGLKSTDRVQVETSTHTATVVHAIDGETEARIAAAVMQMRREVGADG